MQKLLLVLLSCSVLSLKAQESGYQKPPKELADLLLAKPTPDVSLDRKGNWMLLSERNAYPTVEELGQPEIRIAGLRLNPANFSPSRQVFVNGLVLRNTVSGKDLPVAGLPPNLLASNISWSPSENKIAFLHTTNSRVDLYVIDLATQKATRWNKQAVNNTLGAAYTWVNDQTIQYKATTAPPGAAPQKSITPKGPAVQQATGNAAASRTYQDLIRTPYDEELFRFYTTSQLVQTRGGLETKIGTPAIYATVSLSPDRRYLYTRKLHQPFSYLVTAFGFPATAAITDIRGKQLKVLAELPSSESTPSGYDNVQNVPRGFEWRDDEAATIVWAQPLDSGLIRKNLPHHDVVYALAAPFTGSPAELFRTTMRYRGIQWGDSSIALVSEGLRGRQLSRVNRYTPANGTLEKLYELNQTDAYGDPGNPVTRQNRWGRNVIATVDGGTRLLLNNRVGSSPRGDLPFLAKYNLATKKNEIIWRCAEGSYEYITEVIDPQLLVLISRRESQTMVPNFYRKDLVRRIADRPLTQFTNPYPQLEGVSKQKIFYKRADGIDLTGTLYLPKGYRQEKDGPLPVLIWAYPREFNSADDAAQIRGSQDRFTTLSWASPVFYVTQGYAVLDAAEMPIVAKDSSTKPNDTFIAQLELNARAAISRLAAMGVGDSNRVAVGGHSYGAFMTANLLAHTGLFKAGIARSGAYNRTLTPFGFQNEERTYWQAPELYHEMSPFSYADRIRSPLLLIHGEADDNPGTFPINSERLFNAVKGNGGTVRLVMLPYEAHSYRGKENLLHLLWEQYQWLERYVKQAVPRAAVKTE